MALTQEQIDKIESGELTLVNTEQLNTVVSQQKHFLKIWDAIGPVLPSLMPAPGQSIDFAGLMMKAPALLEKFKADTELMLALDALQTMQR